MKWFKRKLHQWATEGGRDDLYKSEKAAIATIDRSVDHESDNNMTINVSKAIGGHIISIRHYNRKTDRNSNGVHIIPESEDFLESLSAIVVQEKLKLN